MIIFGRFVRWNIFARVIREREIGIGFKSFRVRRLELVMPHTGQKGTKIRIEEVGEAGFVLLNVFPVKYIAWVVANPEIVRPLASQACMDDLGKLAKGLGEDEFAYWLGRAGGKRGEALYLGFAVVDLGRSRYELKECLKQVMEVLKGKKVVMVADAGCSGHADLEYLGFQGVKGSERLWIAGGGKVRFEVG